MALAQSEWRNCLAYMSEPTEPEPVKREFRFKPTEFERANPAIAPANDPGAIRVDDMFRQAATPRPAAAKPAARNEVHAMLEANLARANEEGANDVVPTKRRGSRRKRDYWLLVLAAVAIFAMVAATSHNVFVFRLGLGVLAAVILALTWIMWFVMDDY